MSLATNVCLRPVADIEPASAVDHADLIRLWQFAYPTWEAAEAGHWAVVEGYKQQPA